MAKRSTDQTCPAISDDAPHLLIVDDDERIRSLLSRFLSDSGFRVTCASDAASARRYLSALNFDLMILDVMMPGETGMDLAYDLRPKTDMAILMLTARSQTDHRIAGLEIGVDDYLAKPFEPRELLLRIQNILRRMVKEQKPNLGVVSFGPFRYCLKHAELTKNDGVVPLTDREKQILSYIAARAGQIVSRNELLQKDVEVHERTIDVQMNRLRRKIEANPAYPRYLQTVRGQGYRLITD